MSKKTQKELFQMALEEHMDYVLESARKKNKEENIDLIEAIIKEMEPEKKQAIEQFLNRIGDREAEIARNAYVGGLLDGVKIAGVIWLEALRGQCEWDEMID